MRRTTRESAAICILLLLVGLMAPTRSDLRVRVTATRHQLDHENATVRVYSANASSPISSSLIADGATTRRPTRIRKDRLTIQNATVYHLVAEPLRIERKILVHAPVNLSSLSQTPVEIARTASLLQEVCDTAFVHYSQLFPADSGDAGDAVSYLEQMTDQPIYAWTETNGRAVWSHDARQAVQAGAAVGTSHDEIPGIQEYTPPEASEPISSTFLQETDRIPLIMLQESGTLPVEPSASIQVVSEQGESVTQLDAWPSDTVFVLTLTKHNLADAARRCAEYGTTLPDIVTQKDAHLLHRFIRRNQRNGLIGTFLNIMHDDILGRNVNREGTVASRVFPPVFIEQAYCLSKSQSHYLWKQMPDTCGEATKYDDTRSVAYVMYADGRIYTVRQPIYHMGSDFETIASHFEMSNADVIDKSPHLIKLPVICQKSPSQKRSGIFLNQTNSAEAKFQQTYKETIQLCYDTVEGIEAEGAQAQVRLADFIESHGLVRGSDIPIRGKRSMLGAFAMLQGAIKGFSSLRRFLTPIRSLSSRRLFTKVMPESRKAHKMLQKRQIAGRVIAPLAVGAAGLGYGLWQNYRSRRTLQQQRRLVTEYKNSLDGYSRKIGTVSLTVEQNTQAIKTLRDEMRGLGDVIIRVRAGATLLAATAKIHTGLARAQQRHLVQLNTFEVRMRELTEIVVQAHDRQVPHLLTPQLNSVEAVREIPEDSLLPDPSGPVELIPIIAGDILDIYLNFLTGREKWELYDIYPLPRFAGDRMYTRKVTFQHALVGKRLRRYIPISAVESDNCRKGACAGTGVQYRLTADPCTIAMLALKEPHEDCPVEDGPAAPYFRILDNYMVYSVPEPAVASLHCDQENDLAQPGIDKELSLSGIGMLEIPKGCDFQMNEPDISASGPPAIIRLRVGSPESHQLSGSHIHTEKVVAGLTALKANKLLAGRFQANKSKLELFKWIAIGGGIAIAIAILLILLQTSWLYTRLRLVKERLRLATTGLNTAFQSSLMAAARIYRFLSDRELLCKYIEGPKEGQPFVAPNLQRHISTADLRTADHEQISLLTMKPIQAATKRDGNEGKSSKSIYKMSTLRRAAKHARFRSPIASKVSQSEYTSDAMSANAQESPAGDSEEATGFYPITDPAQTPRQREKALRDRLGRRDNELRDAFKRELDLEAARERREQEKADIRQASAILSRSPPRVDPPIRGAAALPTAPEIDDTIRFPSADSETDPESAPMPIGMRQLSSFALSKPSSSQLGARSREITARASEMRARTGSPGERGTAGQTPYPSPTPYGSPRSPRSPRSDRR